MRAVLAEWLDRFVLAPLEQTFLGPGSPLSLFSLCGALLIAGVFVVAKRKKRRDIPVKLLLRAMLPRRMMFSASTRADLMFLAIAVFVTGPVFTWAVVSANFVSSRTTTALASLLGNSHGPGLSGAAYGMIATVALFLAHELAYWTDHYLSHHIPVLWQFHKVHHAAEVLTPMTNARVHPVDTFVYANILALFLGVTGGVLNFAFGRAATPVTVGGTNAVLIVFYFTIAHLQHSHFWIAATGRWGRIFFSPAHHQIHHSADQAHFDRNFGSCLAIWDWMFGTLHVPSRAAPRLRYGVPVEGFDPHGAKGALLMPVLQAWAHLRAPFHTRHA